MFEGMPAWAGNVTAAGALIIIAMLAVTGKLLWHKWVERQIAAIEKQRDDAISAMRDAQEINRIHAEGKRELVETLDTIAAGQAVILKLVQALPRVSGGDQ